MTNRTSPHKHFIFTDPKLANQFKSLLDNNRIVFNVRCRIVFNVRCTLDVIDFHCSHRLSDCINHFEALNV